MKMKLVACIAAMGFSYGAMACDKEKTLSHTPVWNYLDEAQCIDLPTEGSARAAARASVEEESIPKMVEDLKAQIEAARIKAKNKEGVSETLVLRMLPDIEKAIGGLSLLHEQAENITREVRINLKNLEEDVKRLSGLLAGPT